MCYPPQSATVDFNGNPVSTVDTETASAASGSGNTSAAPAANSGNELAEDESLTRQLASSGLFWNLMVFFGLGLLLVFRRVSWIKAGRLVKRMLLQQLSNTFEPTIQLIIQLMCQMPQM